MLKLKLVADRLAKGTTPVPLKLTVCVLPVTALLLSVKVRVALNAPVAAGVNVTLMVQVPLGVIVAPVQVSALVAKSLGFVPPSVAEAMVRLPPPVLVTVTVMGLLVVFRI